MQLSTTNNPDTFLRSRTRTASPEVLYLKSLLIYGDQTKIAKEYGIKRPLISEVFAGNSHNAEVLNAVRSYIRKNNRVEMARSGKTEEVVDETKKARIEKLITKNFNSLKRVAFYITKNRARGEDLVQETVLFLLTRGVEKFDGENAPKKNIRPDFDINKAFVSYCYSYMVQYIQNENTKSRRRGIVYCDEIFDTNFTSTVSNTGESNITCSVIDQEINNVAPTLKIILEKRMEHEQVMKIADAAGLTLTMLKSYWSKAIVPLQQLLQSKLELDPRVYTINQSF